MGVLWPPSLPQAPKLNGFSMVKRSNVVVSSTEQGYQRVRQRFTGKVYDITVSMPPMTTTQKNAFQTFFDDTTSDGTIEFDWYDFSQNPKADQTFRFGQQMPQYKPITPTDAAGNDGYWDVTFTLEMRL